MLMLRFGDPTEKIANFVKVAHVDLIAVATHEEPASSNSRSAAWLNRCCGLWMCQCCWCVRAMFQ